MTAAAFHLTLKVTFEEAKLFPVQKERERESEGRGENTTFFLMSRIKSQQQSRDGGG